MQFSPVSRGRSTAVVIRAVVAWAVLGGGTVATRAAEGWEAVAERARATTCDVLVDDRHHGTAFVVSAEGLVITAAHVVAVGERRIELLRGDNERLAVEIVGRDLGHDLALLRLPEREEPYEFLPLAERPSRVGDEVAVFGTPLYRRQLMLFGRVSRTKPGYEYLGNRKHYVECQYVSGLAPSGTSGGPWLDAKGRIVGMQIGGMSLKSGWQGVSFIAPPAALGRLIEAGKDVATPTLRLAVEETWQQPAEFLKTIPARTDGLVVKILDEEGPAAKAGVMAEDVIVSADGKPIRSVAELLDMVRGKSGGDPVALSMLARNGRPERTVEVPVRLLVEGTAKPE